MTINVQPGEFHGTVRQLLRRRNAERGAQIEWEPRVLVPDSELYVDRSGYIYAQNPQSGKFTILVGKCR